MLAATEETAVVAARSLADVAVQGRLEANDPGGSRLSVPKVLAAFTAVPVKPDEDAGYSEVAATTAATQKDVATAEAASRHDRAVLRRCAMSPLRFPLACVRLRTADRR